MKILITGVAGMLGANFAHWLLKNTSNEVIGIDDLSGGVADYLPDRSDRFKFYCEDVSTRHMINNIFERERSDICYHFACYAAEGRSNYIREFITENNTLSTAIIINACVNHGCKLIFTSSVAVYSGTPPFDESTLPNPIDEYGLSKWTSERSIQIAGEQQNLNWCIIRPRNCYGKFQNIFDISRNVFGIWMYQIRNKEPMTIFGEGNNKRCFTYIDDILAPLYSASFVFSQTINLGSPIACTVKEANNILQEVTGYTRVEHLEPRHEVKDAICSITNSAKYLKYEHRTNLKEGLTKMWNWAQTIPLKERQIPPPLEVNINRHSSIK